MAEGSLGGQKIRKALDLTSWEAASELVMTWEARGKISGHVVTVADAVSKFMDDARARHLTDASLAKCSVVLEKQLVPWCENRGLRYLSHLDVQNVAEFRASWKDGAVAATKKLERLRTFFRFAEDRQWVESNPAKLIRPPKVTQKPTLPFSKEEMERILAACDEYPRKNSLGQDNRARINAFVLLLRFSGLRLQDAVSLRKDRIKDNKLFLYTQKTGTPVFIPLPVAVVAALTSIRSASDDRFFWSGFGNPRSCMSVWDRSLRRVFDLAEVKGGHAHRFRDTFAVELLLSGVPLDQVSVLLGHSSVKVTERHYSPWVKSRQDNLEKLVAQSWANQHLLGNVLAFQKQA